MECKRLPHHIEIGTMSLMFYYIRLKRTAKVAALLAFCNIQNRYVLLTEICRIRCGSLQELNRLFCGPLSAYSRNFM